MSRAIVVGGGVAGLATAALLGREGYEVTLLEARAELGGRAGSWEAGGFRFDTGPSWYLMPEVFEHFFRLLGTTSAEQLRLVRLDPGYRVFFEGADEPLDVAADVETTLARFERLEPGSAASVRRYLDSAGGTARLAVERFLYTDFASPRPFLDRALLRRLPRLVRLLLQPLERFIAGHVRHPRLRQVLGYPAVFLGTSPGAAPAMYHLMSHFDLVDGVRYPMGGFAALVERLIALAEREGATLVRGARVTRIDTEGGRATGVRYTDAEGRERSLDAELVVSTADRHRTETTLLGDAERVRAERRWARAVPGPGAVLVMLGVRGRLPQLAHHNLLFARDWSTEFARLDGRLGGRGDTASLYACRPSATDPGVAPPGDENLFLLVPVPADPPGAPEAGIGGGGVDGAGDPAVERIADAAIAQLAEWAGVPDLAERIVVRRTVGPRDFAREYGSWRGSALGPAHVLRQSAMFRAGTTSRTVAGLRFAGATVSPGIGLPMCLISAELVVKGLWGDRTSERLPEPLRPEPLPSEPLRPGPLRSAPRRPAPPRPGRHGAADPARTAGRA